MKYAYEDRIRETMPQLSPGFKRLADYLLDSYTEAAFLTATELADRLDIDPATVVRFSQRIGYPGYPELLREIRQRVREDLRLQGENKAPAGIREKTEEALSEVTTFVERTRMTLRDSTIEKIVGLIQNARHILVVAERASLAAGEIVASVLEEGGYSVRVSRGSRAELARSISLLGKGDLAIGLDASGESDTVARALRLAQSQGAQTAAVVASASLDAANFADVVLNGQATGDPVRAMVSLMILAHVLLSALRWKEEARFQAQARRVDASLEALGARIFERRE